MTNGEYLGAGASKTKLLLHFEGNANDSSGNGNNGSSTGITYSKAHGKFGQGAGFANSTIGFSSIITPIGAKTISMWIKTTQSTFTFIMRNCQNGNSSYGIGVSIDGVEINRASATHTLSIQSPIPLNDGVWHNKVFTWDGTTNSNSVKLYVDGSLVASSTANYTETNTPTYNLILGNYDANYYYTGSMDEPIIEEGAWSAKEVKKYYTMTKGRFGII